MEKIFAELNYFLTWVICYIYRNIVILYTEVFCIRILPRKEHVQQGECLCTRTHKVRTPSVATQKKSSPSPFFKLLIMPKYRKLPVVIDAFILTEDNIGDLQRWVETFGDDFKPNFNFVDQGPDGATLAVHTWEGTSYNVLIKSSQTAPGDVIIRGVKGEYYPCKADVFAQTYEPVNQ